ncbi:hypothetical protein BHM03_00057993 [Ensete ventricosum]|nr:hypothetical protein BHM03_00057993 [Ensete ventricosum]
MEGGRRAEAESSSAAARAPPESSDDLAEDAKGEFDVGDDEDDGDNEVGRDERGTRCRWVRSVAADSPKGSGEERQVRCAFCLLQLWRVDLTHVRSAVKSLTPCLCEVSSAVSGRPRWRSSRSRARRHGSQVNSPPRGPSRGARLGC